MPVSDNLIISASNYADEAVYSIHAGWWLDVQPITNLSDPDPQLYAVTNGLDPSGTNFLVDLTELRTVGIVGIVNHNLSSTAKWRILFSEDGITTIYDTGELQAWPVVEQFGTLPWGVFNWGGVLPPETAKAWQINSFCIPEEVQLARYLKVYLIDPANEEGELRVGRFWAGPVWQPSINAQLPIYYSFEDLSKVTYSRGGRACVDEAPRRRVIRFTVSYLPEAEMMTQVFDQLDRANGISGDLILIPKPNEPDQMHRQAIYCRQRQLNEISESFTDQLSRDFIFEENI
jgi:hypothetical protein